MKMILQSNENFFNQLWAICYGQVISVRLWVIVYRCHHWLFETNQFKFTILNPDYLIVCTDRCLMKTFSTILRFLVKFLFQATCRFILNNKLTYTVDASTCLVEFYLPSQFWIQIIWLFVQTGKNTTNE